jgi:hypothetical protein
MCLLQWSASVGKSKLFTYCGRVICSDCQNELFSHQQLCKNCGRRESFRYVLNVLHSIERPFLFGQPLPTDGVNAKFIQYPTTINNGELRSLLTDGRVQVGIALIKELSDYNARVTCAE